MLVRLRRSVFCCRSAIGANPTWLDQRPGDNPHADWLIKIFDRWYGTTPSPTRILLFEEIMALILGGYSRTESIGLGVAGLIVIETDGTFELVDALKSTFEGAPATGLNIFQNSLDDALLHPGLSPGSAVLPRFARPASRVRSATSAAVDITHIGIASAPAFSTHRSTARI
ncbi:hypothetical protein NKG94_08865 [Micromonospora sp. M12]